MKISYKKLWVLLIQKDISKATLRKDVGLSTGTMSKLNKGEIPKAVFRKETELSPGTMSKLNKNEEVALSVLLRICEYLNCDIGDICEAIHTDK